MSEVGAFVVALLLEGRKATPAERDWLKTVDVEVQAIKSLMASYRARESVVLADWQAMSSDQRRAVVLRAMAGDNDDAVARLCVVVELSPACATCGGSPPRLTVQGDLPCAACRQGTDSSVAWLPKDFGRSLFRVTGSREVQIVPLCGVVVIGTKVRPLYLDGADGQLKVARNTRTEQYVLAEMYEIEATDVVPPEAVIKRCLQMAARARED